MTTQAQERQTSPGLIVSVTGGRIRGVREGDLLAWRGVPYAAPPSGALRFRAPRPVQPWPGVREAAAFGNVAPQDHRGQFRGASLGTPMAEDCLNLNVFAPAEPGEAARRAGSEEAGRGLPVMVFIHGGAYSVGSSRDAPGKAFVRGGVIYVSVNYRLGALGYLDFTRYSTPERVFEDNLGLRDQVAALEWVRENIASFGGNPENVTIFGESAGGNAVTTLMATPAAQGLFHRAIAQSAPVSAVYQPELTAKWAAEFAEILAGIVPGGADRLPAQLLDDAGMLELVEATTALQLRTPDEYPGTLCLCPVVDEVYLPERPLDAFEAGRAARVPLIIGTNDREGSLFRGRIAILASTPGRVRAIFAKTRKKPREAIKAQYPGLPRARAAADFAGDYSFWYPSMKIAERHSRFAPVHVYRFDHAPRLAHLIGLDATHGIELYGLFDRIDDWLVKGMSLLGGLRSFRLTGERMRRRWLAFAWSGDPNTPFRGERLQSARMPGHRAQGQPQPLVRWPLYEEGRRLTLIIGETDRVEADPRGARLRVWKDFVPHV